MVQLPKTYKPWSYGNALARRENTTGRQIQNALAAQSADPNSLDNQIRKAQLQKLQREAQTPNRIKPTANIQDYEYYQSLDNKGKAAFNHILRGQNVKKIGEVWHIIPPDGNPIPLSTLAQEIDAKTQVNEAERLGTLQADIKLGPTIEQQNRQAIANVDLAMDPKIAGAVEAAKVTGRAGAEKQAFKPQELQKVESAAFKADFLKREITKAKSMSNAFTTGWFGGQLKDVEGTPAFDLQQTLLGIKANLGFDRLQQMREQSKTGGALGNVSEREGQKLEAVWGSLEQAQSQRQFIQALDNVERQVNQSYKLIAEAYERDYGVPWDGVSTAPQGASNGGWTIEAIK